MENYEIAEILTKTAKLMELHDENSFKIKSLQNAAFKLDRLPEKIFGKSIEELEKVDGIGKSLSVKLHAYFADGIFQDLLVLIQKTPLGVLEMMEIKGIGPKKVAALWKELGVESPGELLYACNENRLIELKGFGEKTQDKIKKAIEFKIANAGLYHFSVAEQIGKEILVHLQKKSSSNLVSFVGALRRKCEIVEKIEILISEENTKVVNWLNSLENVFQESITIDNEVVKFTSTYGISATIECCNADRFYYNLWNLTGSEKHIEQVKDINPDISKTALKECVSEHEIYKKYNLAFIEPELREGIFEIDLALKNHLPTLVQLQDLKGVLHNHSTWSDGIHSLEEMANECKRLGYEYFGICDHSKTAFYANGLSIERVLAQHLEIDALNKKLSPFKIFKGIESDILNDGSLDYPEEILKTFDFIVASIHSNLKMEEVKATQRLLTAIENPYTTILGHPTGRLILAREGYPIDHKKIIDACAENNVIIELNAHPYRLDLDWRWIQYCVKKGVKISINPDAHAKEGFGDLYYGICAARKGGLTKDFTFNAQTLDEVTNCFQKKKK
jgi:DNA polymerase (family 10)